MRKNRQNENTPCTGKTRIMLEIFEKLNEWEISKQFLSIVITTDNEKLCNVLQKENHTENECTHDAGAIIAEIDKRQRKLQVSCEFAHCLSHVMKPEKFEDYPIACIRGTCDEKSKQAREDLSEIVAPVILPMICQHTMYTDHREDFRAIKEMMRKIKSDKEKSTCVEKKFREHIFLVDIRAMKAFPGRVIDG